MSHLAARCFLFALATAAAAPALAVYKIVRLDGSITYTDRHPVGDFSRVVDLNLITVQTDPTVALPQELRTVTQRYPVVLYSAPDCVPCDAGRQMLQLRGVPFNERLVTSADDALALERAVGGRTVPALKVGSQALRGLSESDWTAYLDAAGYPRESRLPRGWQPPVATPLVDREPARPAPRAAPAARPEPAAATPADTAAPGSFRF